MTRQLHTCRVDLACPGCGTDSTVGCLKVGNDPTADPRTKAAQQRVRVAIGHLEKARAQLDDACTDLSTVQGAAREYDTIRKLSIATLNARRSLDENAHAAMVSPKPWTLDHKPTEQEERCGHGPKHGCGRGGKGKRHG